MWIVYSQKKYSCMLFMKVWDFVRVVSKWETMIADVLNAVIAIAIVTLTLNDNIQSAIIILGSWCPVDMYLVCRSFRGTVEFRKSLMIHHMITFILCVQFGWFVLPREFLKTLLCLEITTPIMCVHNIMRTRLTWVFRIITWVIVRGIISFRLINFIFDGVVRGDDGICQAAPYVVALITLSVAWTFGYNANVSSLQLLLVVVVARVKLSLSRYLGMLLQIPASYMFYNLNGYEWVDHGVLLYNMLRLYQGLSIVSSIVIPVILSFNEIILSIVTNIMCAYQLLKEPTAERVLCSIVMCAYTIGSGTRHLTFGNRISWHMVCTVALVRCIPVI